MSEYNFSISLRRPSISSKKAITLFNDYDFNISAFKKAKWFDAYLYLMENQDLFYDNHQLIDEILKLLFDDGLIKEVVIHLLSLLEYFHSFFQDADLLEQVIGSLLNAYSVMAINKEIKVKYLYTITSLLVTNIEIVKLNSQLEFVADNFILKLIGNIEKNYLAECSTECLVQFDGFYDTKLQTLLKNIRLNKNNIPLIAVLFKNQIELKSQTEVSEILIDENIEPICQARALIGVFNFIKTNSNQNIISVNFFKQFLDYLIYSKEISLFHLALVLLKNFDLIFSSHEEQSLINQLFTLCVHPSLISSHRLMMLDFAENFVHLTKIKNYLNMNIFEICDVLDGPDTQEKKLKILLQTKIKDEALLVNLKPLKMMCLTKNNNRASNSLYRVLHSIIQIRPSMTSKIEYLILSMILKSPSRFISRTISLLKLNQKLTENLLKLIIEETNNHFDNFQNENDLKQYFLAFEWILNTTRLSCVSNLIVLSFLTKKCENRPNLFKGLLACCATIIRKQILNDEIRIQLKDALYYLSEKGKKNIELVSWAQIYLIAIDTLPTQENINKVFIELELTNGDYLYNELETDQCPINFERVKCTNRQIDKYDYIDYPFKFILKLSIKDEFSEQYPILLCINVLVKVEKQNTQNEKLLSILKYRQNGVLVFDLKPKLIDDFELKVFSRFTDTSGKIYRHLGIEMQFKFFELIQSSSLTRYEFNKLWDKFLNDDKICKGVIVLSRLKTVNEFLEHFSWAKECSEGDYLSFITPSSYIALIKLLEINNIVNLRIMTNNVLIINRLEQELNDV